MNLATACPEDYPEAVHSLGIDGANRVPVSRLAWRLGVTPGSVSAIMRTPDELGLVSRSPWDPVHSEAEVLEHVLASELEQTIDPKLGDPTRPRGEVDE